MRPFNFRSILAAYITLSAPLLLSAQELNETAATDKIIPIDFNWVLTGIALFLVIPLYLASKTLLYAIRETLIKNNIPDPFKKSGLVILLLGISQLAEAKTGGSIEFTIDCVTWVIVAVIILEIFMIVFFSMQTNKYLRPAREYREKTDMEGVKAKAWYSTLWDRMNKFRPLSEEANIDTGHSYDGIRELDNITPPWFVTGFIISILFAGVYLYRYHIAKSAPLQIEEFNTEMAEAEEAKAKFLSLQANKIDENSVKMLSGADIDAGKGLFAQTCTACHGPSGGSMQGGVGPNLTDDYWVHGGSIKDIFKTIKYGWPEKGMISWKDNFSPRQIAQLASYIKSLKGSHPAGAKDPQGELYQEQPDSTSVAVKDTTAVKL